jgi:peptidoglycan/xylan/chitin deacetylase (PgdA/CDA1 family)
MSNKSATTFKVSITIVFAILMFSLGLKSLLPIVAYSQLQPPENQGNKDKVMVTKNESVNSNSSNNKVVILNFDDSHMSEYTYAKPILDRYGFKATFFEICSRMSDRGWKLIADMKDDGMDIQSHSMTHPSLDGLSQSQLDFEIGQSKQCFLDHGVNTTIFAYPYGHGSDNATVVDEVAKNYYLARTNHFGATPLAHLLCHICTSATTTTTADDDDDDDDDDDRTSADDRTVTSADRYNIDSWLHQHIEGDYSYLTQACASGTCKWYNNSEMLQKFIAYVNSQDSYNEDGIIRAVPIVVYHDIIIDLDVSNSKNPNDITMNLLDDEMKYLHDNGFRVLTMADLGYDENNKYVYINTTSSVE